MSFTSILGTSDSLLGHFILGYFATINPPGDSDDGNMRGRISLTMP